MDVERGFDRLRAHWRSDKRDLAYLRIGDKLEVSGGRQLSHLHWVTDYSINKRGWQVFYRPHWPKIVIPQDTRMPTWARGVRIAPVFHQHEPGLFWAGWMGLEASNTTSRYVETPDWIRSQATCTSTMMRCPVPAAYADHE